MKRTAALACLLLACEATRPLREGAGGESPTMDDPPQDVAGTSGAPSGVASPDGGAAEGGSESVSASGGALDECNGGAAFDERVSGLALHELALFQGVKVSLMENGVAIEARKTGVVGGRSALFRAYVRPVAGWLPRVVRGRLSLKRASLPEQPLIVEQTRFVEHESNDAELGSTFNFTLPPEAVADDARYSIELLETQACAPDQGTSISARFPRVDDAALGPVASTNMEVRVVPIRNQVGDVTLDPDTSPEQMELLRAGLLRVFPVASVQLTLRPEPLETSASTMVEVLDHLAALQEAEQPSPTLAYYGLVRLTETKEQYCRPSCVLGASFNGVSPSLGVGVGVGYTGEAALTTMIHELGHVYGRPHTPCGVSGDAAYPYSRGRIGSWGYDVTSRVLFDPTLYADFMGYCSPTWVSDHTFEQLREFIMALGMPTSSAVDSLPRSSQVYRALLLEPGREPSWGVSHRLRAAPPGAQLASVLATGGGETITNVYTRRVADDDAEVVYVPASAAKEALALRYGGRRIVIPRESARADN